MSEQRPRVLVAALISMPNPLRMLLTQHSGSRHWHFPDGEVAFGETIAKTIRRSLNEDLRVTPEEIDERVCMPTDTINMAKKTHFVTLHFVVRLPIGLQIMPRKGLKVYWCSTDPRDHSNLYPLMPSTVEIFRRLNENIK